MSDRRCDIQVGLFSIIGVLLLAMMILVFGGFKDVLTETYSISAHFANAAGTAQGTPVRLLGIEVGSVKSIALDEQTGGVTMALSVNRNVDIREDAPLSIKQEGFIANIYLEFGMGSSDVMLAKDGTARIEGSVDTFATYIERATGVLSDMGGSVQERVGDISDRLLALIDNLNGITGDEKFQQDFKTLAANSAELTGELKNNLPGLLASLRDSADAAKVSIARAAELFDAWQEAGVQVADAAKVARKELQERGENIGKLTISLSEAGDDVAALARNLSDVTNMVKNGEGTVGKAFTDAALYRSLVSAIDQLEEASAMFKELAETIKKHPDWLLKGPPENRE